jgi:hypothetical protein
MLFDLAVQLLVIIRPTRPKLGTEQAWILNTAPSANCWR